MDNCPTGYLLRCDACKAYKISIDYMTEIIDIKGFRTPVRVLIASGMRHSTKRIDLRIYIIEMVLIQPFSKLWIPVKFTHLRENTDLLIIPI